MTLTRYQKTVTTQAATITDQGVFSAIAAAWSVDRMQERIIPGAFANTIERWKSSGKMIPLHWDHKGDADQIIGYIDPSQLSEQEAGLYVEGKLDLEDSDVAREAWRSMRNGAVGLSFGYLVLNATKSEAGDDITDLNELDVFEFTITPAPVNPDTKVLSMKSVTVPITTSAGTAAGEVEITVHEPEKEPPSGEEKLPDDGEKNLTSGEKSPEEKPEVEDPGEAKRQTRAQDPLRQETERAALELALGRSVHEVPPDAEPDPEPEPEPVPDPPSDRELRRRTEKLALDDALGGSK